MSRAVSILRLAFLLGAAAMRCEGGAATSVDYVVEHDVLDAGGGESSAGVYRQQASSGGLPGGAAGSAMEGFAGELWHAQALRIEAATEVAEASVFQLVGELELDDHSVLRLAPGLLGWSSVSGPITQINAAGQASAGHVYRDSPAIIRATLGPLSTTCPITIRDVFSDDFGLYAGDGIDDIWQVDHFGVDNPDGAADADPSGTGQDNLFKFTAGLDPKDPHARFSVSVIVNSSAKGVLLQMGPCFEDRNYALEWSLDLVHWQAAQILVKSGQASTGTYSDLTGYSPKKFYRVVITRK